MSNSRLLYSVLGVLTSLVLASCGSGKGSLQQSSGGQNQWTWVGGANAANKAGVYGTQGAGAPGNAPGARKFAAVCTDSSGNAWVFGGDGDDSTGTDGWLNDIWKYSGGQWTWIGGQNISTQLGNYGTLGVPAPDNVPPSRFAAVTSVDANGDFWVFGGHIWSLASGPEQGSTANDLWKYSGGLWTWVGGLTNAIYGTEGTPAPGNFPGARESAVGWTDANRDFWIFGGAGFDSTGANGLLNDLWRFSGGQWTWMGGSNLGYQVGTYGTQGTAAPGNIPGARTNAAATTDAKGNFWLFGGTGFDSTGTPGDFNDLWEYSGGQWTWVAGSNQVNQAATYGTQGTGAAGNVPGARYGAALWIDAAGNAWVFGGSHSELGPSPPEYNDLWKYSGGQWAWMAGSNLSSQFGTYGTQGSAATGNTPGARFAAASWTDANGNLLLFGGGGYSSSDTGALNDLWSYNP